MKADFLLLDGAMGTMLQAAGLPLGARPDIFGAQHPETVTKIHKAYLDAGSDVIYANTFGSNAHKLKGTGHTVADIVTENVLCARKAADGRAKVATDIGPIGELLAPLGTLRFEEAYACYREMAVAGEQAGADLTIIETFTDLQDARAALLAAKENTSLPVWVTMSFESNGRTFTGTDISAAALTLTGLGADAIGINCSLGPREILPLIEKMRSYTDLPIIVKPNAGLPDPATGEYGMDAESFAKEMEAFLRLGVMAMGGCCGTTPDFIRALKPLRGKEISVLPRERKNGICSASRTVEYGGLHPVGERLNPTGKKRLQQALTEGDYDFIAKTAIEQADAGAEVLDVNCGLPGIDEASVMEHVVTAVQGVVDVPLQIDASHPEVIEAGLRIYCGKAILNSVNGSEKSLSAILPIAKKYGSAIVALLMDENGLPKTVEGRMEIARRIILRAAEYGIAREDILVDALTLTVSAQQDQALMTLEAMRRCRQEYGVHATLGVSNISFGLPVREEVTRVFLAEALFCGLDFPIINPNLKSIMDTVSAHRALSGEDRDCLRYIDRFSNAPKEPVHLPGGSKPSMEIETAISLGLKEETARLAAELLTTMSEVELINGRLIPALDRVGKDYEKQVIFLPQLINAANAACAAFDLIKDRIAKSGKAGITKGKIIIATVHGDIHDIGKNIVKVILENYGYTLIDLGKDVPKETVVDAAIREDVRLVGLSALMTTTVASMKETIAALRASGHPCKIFVGGAVLTEEYAAEIGADYYAKDAAAAVDIAKEVLS